MDSAPEISKLPHDPNSPDPASVCPKYCGPKSLPSTQTDDAGDAQRGEHPPRGLNMDKNYLDTLNYEKDLAEITCGCGHGYFKSDKTWVSGADVRAGVAPPKPQ